MEKNKKTLIIILVILAICLVAFSLYKYLEYRSYSSNHFQKGTNINGLDCSGLTKEEVIGKLTTEWNGHEFTITENGATLIVLKKLDFTYKIDKSVQEALDNAAKFPLYSKIFNKTKDLTIAMIPDTSNTNFETQINTLSIFDSSNDVLTKNAYLDLTNSKCSIVPEVYGTNVSRVDFENKIANLIGAGTWTLAYQKKDFYEQPTIKSDNKELLAKQEYAKKYLSFVIKYTFGSTGEAITPAQLDKMISVDKEGKKTINNKAVKSFVSNLAAKHNTAGCSFNFNSTSSGTVTVGPGSYGYSINQAKEIKKLTEELEAGKDVTREPIYSQKGKGWENGGVGTTYVEISIGGQHVWYYENGVLALSTDVVTGNVSGGTTTPRGAYYLEYKSADATLKGENTDGSKYETPVDCWMPFSGGYGMHDANWRDSFGGSIYLKNGSHGCVNMPPSQAHSLFNMISPGCPVIIY